MNMNMGNKRWLARLCVCVLICTTLLTGGWYSAENSYAAIKTIDGIALGDVNRDGEISAKDALLILKRLVRLNRLDESQIKLGDVNENGKLEAQDALLILRKVVKLINNYDDPLPTPKPKPVTDGVMAPSTCGALHVDGRRLVDEKGREVQLKGVSTHGIAWFPDYINEECFKQLRTEWKANVVRLAMYTAEYNGYCNGGDRTWLKNLIDQGVNYATRQDMYVIIDWHVLNDQNPNKYLAESKEFFAEISKKYAGKKNVIYEICNEPNGGTSWSEIKKYAETIIPVIRANDKNAVILVGTPNWSQYVDQAAADPIRGYSNIMYTLHFYAATHTDSLRQTMEQALNAGLPIFVSEYGICDASGNGGINEAQANQWVGLLNKYKVSYVSWSLCNKDETASLIKSSCSKTSGFTKDDLSPSGQWVFNTISGGNPGVYVPSANPGGNSQGGSSSGGSGSSPVATGNVGALKYQITRANGWTSGNETFTQYCLTIENPTGADISGWSATVQFSQPVTLSSSWNGNFSLSGQKLKITPMDYNGTIGAGKSVTDIGFIVSGGGEVTIVK